MHVIGCDDQHLHAALGLQHLVFDDASIRAEHVPKGAGGHRVCAVDEVVVTTAADVGDPRERAPARTRFGPRRDLVTEVVPDEGERTVRQTGGQRANRRFVGRHGCAVGVDAFEDHFVLADVQPRPLPAADGLHTEFG